MYKQMIQIAAMLILLVGAANGQTFDQNPKPEPIVGAFFYNGVETSPGVLEQAGSTRYGNSYILDSTGEWETRHLTVSLNYYSSLPSGATTLTILGGSWSMITYDLNGQYQGTLYGDVVSGVIDFKPDASGNVINKKTSAQLMSTGYLRPFLLPIKRRLRGTLEMTTNLDSPQTSGTLNLNF